MTLVFETIINGERGKEMKKFQEMYHEDFFKGVAHRGLHDGEKTENGMKAFQNAINHGLAFEYDIHLTKDGELVVCHDAELERTTGKKGIIEELTLKEIKEGYRLFDGGEIPTLKEVYDLNGDRQTMVVELKPENGNDKALAAATHEFFLQNPAEKIIFISFSRHCLYPLKDLGHPRQLLICKEEKGNLFFHRPFEGLDVEFCLLDSESIKRYAKDHILNAWTIESLEDYRTAQKICDGITFQHIDVDKI